MSISIEERFKRDLYETYESKEEVYYTVLENVKVARNNKSTKSRQHYYFISASQCKP